MSANYKGTESIEIVPHELWKSYSLRSSLRMDCFEKVSCSRLSVVLSVR